MDLIVLDTKEITGPAAVETVRNVKKIGQEQFQAFTRECLVERTKSINDAIRRNKLKVFNTSTPRSVSKGKQQLASHRNDVAFSHGATVVAIRGMETLKSSFVMRIKRVLQLCPMEKVSV